MERPCPSCPGSIEGDDPHTWCIECLGSDHAAANLPPSAVCSACRLLPRSSRLQRLALFEGCYVSPVEDPELDVVEMEDLVQGVPFVFAILAAWTGMMKTPRRPGSPVTARKAISRTGLHVRTSRR